MAERRGRDLTVGVLFALALIILSLTVMAVGQESRLFSAKSRYLVIFPNADGLSVGSAVKMSGVQVGTVSAIRLPTDPSQFGIEITVGVDSAYALRVRQDSRAALRTVQYLTGEKSVEIIPGSASQPELPEGSLIERLEETEIMEQVGMASQNLSEITVSLKNILGALERGEGLMGQMINDPEFGKQGLEALRGSFENLQALTDGLLQGQGFMGRLLNDDAFAASIDDLGLTIQRLSSLTAKLDVEQGAVGALLEEGGPAEQALLDLGESAASLRRITARLESDEGFVGRLLRDPEYSEALADDLRAILANTAEITGKINRGEGTLGALVNDMTLYDGLEDVVAGVNDSKFARWMLRHYQKKGIKQQDQPPAGDAPTETTAGAEPDGS